MKKHYIVKWWNGCEEVWASNELEAKAKVAALSVAYKYYGRGAYLEAEEVK